MGFEIEKTSEEIVLNDYRKEIDRFVEGIKRFNRAVIEFRPYFEAYVDGVGIEYNKTWVNNITSNMLSRRIGEHLEKYLQNHPKFMRQAIDKSFTEQVSGLYTDTFNIQTAYKSLTEGNYNIPYGSLTTYFQQNEDGTYIIDDASIQTIVDKMSIKVSNDDQKDAYSIIQEMLNCYERLYNNLNDEKVVDSFIKSFFPGFEQNWSPGQVRERVKNITEFIIKSKSNG